MKRIRITKEFTFEMAHALRNHDGPCKNIHGHSYSLAVTVMGTPVAEEGNPKQGMVWDFSELKHLVNHEIISRLDHALVLKMEDTVAVIEQGSLPVGKLVMVPYQPTCENLLLDFAERLLHCLPEKVKLVRLLLRETPSSYAEWLAEENEFPGAL